MLCDAISYWRGKGGRREGVKELSLLLSLLISLLLSRFRGFPVVLFHCPLNWSTCSSTYYSSIGMPQDRTDQRPRPLGVGAQRNPARSADRPSDSQVTDHPMR